MRTSGWSSFFLPPSRVRRTACQIGLLLGLSIVLRVAQTQAQNVPAPATPAPATTYAFTLPVPVEECSFEGVKVDGTGTQARMGGKFYYVQAVPSNAVVVIRFLTYSFKDTPQLYQRFNSTDTLTTTPKKFFCVAQKDFDRFTRRSYAAGLSSHDFVVGALVLPVKLRPGAKGAGFDFANDVAFGTTAGYRYRTSDSRENFLSLLAGVALSSVQLTAENTNGKLTETTDRPAFTWTTGMMFEVNRFQIGAFIGQDRISQPRQSSWAFQGKTWFALGLGYTLFGGVAEQPATGEQSR
jgi:hypothetical protein